MSTTLFSGEGKTSSSQNSSPLESVVSNFSYAAAFAAVLDWRSLAFAWHRVAAVAPPSPPPDPDNDLAELDVRGASDVGLGPGEWEPRVARGRRGVPSNPGPGFGAHHAALSLVR